MRAGLRQSPGGRISRPKTFLGLLALGYWLLFVIPCHALEDIYESRLDKGLRNSEPYSYLLMEMARQDRTNARGLLNEARRYSPDLPAVYFELGRENLSLSAEGLFQGLDFFRQGLRAYGRNFWWEFSLAGLLYLCMFFSLFLSLIVVLLIRVSPEAGLILHEAMEERKRLLLFAIPAVLSLLGPVAFVAGALFLIGLYLKKENKAVTYAAVLLLLFSPFILRGAVTFLSAPPVLKAAVSVNEGKDNRYALWILKGRDDFASLFSYALALKREGKYQEAIEAYGNLIGRFPKPGAGVYVNLGNSFYGAQALDAAKESYHRSIGIAPLPSAYYNLSQVYRESLDFIKGDEYFLEAARLSPEAVSRFSSILSSNPNRFVVDETLPDSLFWQYALVDRTGAWSFLEVTTVLVAIIMIPGFYFFNRKMKFRAQRCKRCGAVFCSRCSREITWGEMCPRCYGSLIKIDEVDSRERIARLLSIYQIQTKRRKTARLASYIVPGAGQIYSGKVLSGMIFLWPFLFSLALLIANSLPGAGPFPFCHGWMSPLALVLLMLSYVSSVLHLKRRIQKGWL